MTGLDLESFLLLLRADLGVWLMLGLASLGLAFLVWSSWRSRRALRNCLVLSLAAHLALVVLGSTFPGLIWSLSPNRRYPDERSHIREIRVATLADRASRHTPRSLVSDGKAKLSGQDAANVQGPRWDLVDVPLALEDQHLQVGRPTAVDPLKTLLSSKLVETGTGAAATAVPKATPLAAAAHALEPRAAAHLKPSADLPAAAAPLPPDAAEIERGLDETETAGSGDERRGAEEPTEPSTRGAMLTLRFDRRLRPDRSELGSVKAGGSRPRGAAEGTGRGPDLRASRSDQPAAKGLARVGNGATSILPLDPDGGGGISDSIPTVRAVPKPHTGPSGALALAALGERTPRQASVEIPRIYQPRLEPDRFVQAQRIGASGASELAVERAIDWLTRHQDKDGRWDAGTARYSDGTAVKDDDDFTVHCPPGETCFGECAYWEADTALTGLALLTYLGAGYTHVEGRYADNVSRGLDFLLSEQKRDGDLRGRSKVVGMYCHAMATLALCEAYALSGDARLRGPVERAVAFMVSARAADGMAWRYAPGAPAGDTSILGWVVMVLKSAKEIGIPIPEESSVRGGTLLWLEKVAAGDAKGLARYQPSEPVTPTMTAEAWVCRQFLGAGGPGAASSEAAGFLQEHESDRGPSNMYYWYYATLALYQHGGEPWSRWNGRLRDKIVGLQRSEGHQTGSWEPDTSLYGSKGGRIYCTALAALTLEVYYRYLRLYDEPKIPPLEAKDESASAKR
jgi:hypothetical protein